MHANTANTPGQRSAWRWLMLAILPLVLLLPVQAWAGELLLGPEPFETDNKGNVTKASRAKAITEVEASAGDESWTLYIWARIDKAAVGPLYLEFYRERNGKKLVAHREEILDFAGDKYLSMDLEIYRSDGFKPDESVEMAFVQNVGGRDAKKAVATITLKPSAAPPPSEDDGDGDDDDGDDDDAEDGDDDDDVEAGDDDDADDDDDDSGADGAADAGATGPASEAPPPVSSGDKKGCSVGPEGGSAWALLLVVAGWSRRRKLSRT